MKSFFRKKEGFTLIELLVVIALLAILLAVTLIAINPGRQIAQANNTQRRSDVLALLNAIDQYAADNKGNLPPGMPQAGSTINIAASGAGPLETGSAFCSGLVPTYMVLLPKDPTIGTYTNCFNYVSQYTVSVATVSAGSTPRVTVNAPWAELSAVISVTR